MQLADYKDRFDCASIERRDGIIEVTLGTNGGSLVWGPGPHRELAELFDAIGSDRENRVVILTGAGENFCVDRDNSMSSLRSSADGWDQIYWEGKRLLESLLSIEVPVIGAVNGPAHHHAEIPIISDIVLASSTATFQDHAHFHSGVVPGDGVQVIWPMVLGPNRGRYFLLTGQVLTAADALGLGAVSEVLEPERLLPRARELAATIASRPVLTTRYTRVVLTERIRRAVSEGIGYGLALEGIGILSAVDAQRSDDRDG